MLGSPAAPTARGIWACFSCSRNCSRQRQGAYGKEPACARSHLKHPSFAGVGLVGMIRVLGTAANGMAPRLQPSKSWAKHSRRNYAYSRRFSGDANQNSPWRRHVGERKARRSCVSCIFQLLERLAPSVHRRCAECSVRLGRCEVALNIEGVAGALIGFPVGATLALSVGMIVLGYFHGHGRGADSVGRREIRFWSGPGRRARTPTRRGDEARISAAKTNRRVEQCYLQTRGGCPRYARERATRCLGTAKIRIVARIRQHLGGKS